MVTLSSGLLSSLGNLGNTSSSVPTLLAMNLPGAVHLLPYLVRHQSLTSDYANPGSILTATLSGAAKSYSRVVPWVMFLLKGILGGNTPRKVYMSTVSILCSPSLHADRPSTRWTASCGRLPGRLSVSSFASPLCTRLFSLSSPSSP